MDKATPKSDRFKANRDRAAPLLEKLKADGIGSIDGAQPLTRRYAPTSPNGRDKAELD